MIGIRREDKSPWEKRSPLTPQDVAALMQRHNLDMVVQPSPIRVFRDAEYAAAGATVDDDLGGCSIVLGVKEIPAKLLLPDKTYVLFSHTIKGQPHNMPMLRRLMELGCSLIDYEMITDDAGQRLIFFGDYAGYAGMIDTLWALGRRMEFEGRRTPLAELRPAHQYDSLDAAIAHLRQVAAALARGGSMAGFGPVVCGFSGYGRVSQGAQKIYDELSPRTVQPQDLASTPGADGEFVKVVFREEHMVEPIAGGAFDLKEYYEHPERYRSIFEPYLPHLTLLVNGIHWTPKYPRLVTLDALRRLYGGASPPRLKVIGDISCDLHGSIECTVRATDPSDPVYVYDVTSSTTPNGVAGNGPVILAVDFLPAELPRESSQAFSRVLIEMIPVLASTDRGESFEAWALPAALKRAVILHRGHLTPSFSYMNEFVGK